MIDRKRIIMTAEQAGACIDKSVVLEKYLGSTPSIYIEGAAASGKTTAVRMLVTRKEDLAFSWFDLSTEEGDTVARELEGSETVSSRLLVFDRLELCTSETLLDRIVAIIRASCQRKVILISREKPAPPFQDLFWKNLSILIPRHCLDFTIDDIRDLASKRGVFINPSEFMEETGGWAGCVSLLMTMTSVFQDTGKGRIGRLGSRAHPVRSRNLPMIRHMDEVESYIEREILGGLCPEDRALTKCAMACPWISEEMGTECLKMDKAAERLEDLARKGMLARKGKGRYRAVNLLRSQKRRKGIPWKAYSTWYYGQGCFGEAYDCLYQMLCDRTGNDPASAFRDAGQGGEAAEAMLGFLRDHYEHVPYTGLDYSFVLQIREDSGALIYLRAMCYYQARSFEEFRLELEKAAGLKDQRGWEIYINLLYADPSISARDFLRRTEKLYNKKPGTRFCLYHILGDSPGCFCGPRDLSSLFACSKREEAAFARTWKNLFGEPEWKMYQIYRLDYYMETGRTRLVEEEIARLLIAPGAGSGETTSLKLYRFYLSCRRQTELKKKDEPGSVLDLREELLEEAGPLLGAQVEEIYYFCRRGGARLEALAGWIRDHEGALGKKPDETNCIFLLGLVKGMVLLQRYDRAAAPVAELVEYLGAFRRHRFLAEVLFIQALIHFQQGEKGAALRNTIESFAEGGGFRYVSFYADYGDAGLQVLNQYVEWQEAQNPTKWQRKKKYDYRSVLNMQEADYLNAVIRSFGRKNASGSPPEQNRAETLTMTEMVVLQSLSRGISNEQIAEELNLKVTTVKSHLYSIYKKMGVKTRMEAIGRARAMRIVQ